MKLIIRFADKLEALLLRFDNWVFGDDQSNKLSFEMIRKRLNKENWREKNENERL